MSCSRWSAIVVGVMVGGLATLPVAVNAQTFSWSNVTGDFSNGVNWAGGVAPTGLDSAATLQFSGNAAYTATNDVAVTGIPFFYLNDLFLGSSAGVPTVTGVGAFPNQPRLKFSGPGATITQSGTGAFTVGQPIWFDTNTTLTIAPGSGPLTLAGTTNANAFFGFGNLTVANNSANTVLIGNMATFFGDLKIAAGTAQAAFIDGDLFGEFTTLDVAAGATYNFNANGEQMGAIGGAGTIVTGGGAGLTFFKAGNSTFSGIIQGGTGSVSKSSAGEFTLAGNADLQNTGSLTTSIGTTRLKDNAVASASTGFSVTAGGTLTLDNSNAGSSANNNNRLNDGASVSLTDGTLRLLGRDGTATSEAIVGVTVNPPLTLNPGVVVNTGASHIEVVAGNGPGSSATLTLGGADGFGSHAGLGRNGTTPRGATVDFAIGANSAVVLNNQPLQNGILGGWATIGDEFATIDGSNQVVPLAAYQTSTNPAAWAATDNVKITAAPTAGVTTQSIHSLNLASNQTVAIDVGAVLTLESGGLLAGSNATLTGGTITSNNHASARDLIVAVSNPAATLTVESVVANQGTNTVALTKSGPGKLVLTGTNTYSGNTILNEGVLEITDLANVGPGGFVFNGGTLTTSTNFLPATPRGGDIGASGGIIDVPAGLQMRLGNFSGAGAMTKIGPGELIINNANSFAGDMIVLEGTAGTPNTTTAGSFFPNSTILRVAAGATFNMNDNPEDFGGIAGAGTINMGTSISMAITLLQANRDEEFSGDLQGAGQLVLSASSRLTLSGPSSFTGPTTIRGGILQIGATSLANQPGPLGNSNTDVLVGNTSGAADASLLISQSGVEVGRPVIVQAGNTGLLTVGSKHTSGDSMFSGELILNRPIEMPVEGTANTAFSGTISGAGDIVKSGTGTATFSGANIYTGATSVAAGALLVDGSHTGGGNYSVGAGAKLGGAGTIDVGGNTVRVDGVLAPGSSIESLDVAASTLALNGTLQIEVAGEGIDLLAIAGGLTLGASSVLDIVGTLTQPSYTIATFNSGSLIGTFGNTADLTSQGYTISYESDKIVLSGGGPVLVGDVNHDGTVDIFDVNLVSDHWGDTGAPGIPGDANSDGTVDIFDVNTISDHWGEMTMSGGAAAVPEPSTWALAVAVLLGATGLRRWRR